MIFIYNIVELIIALTNIDSYALFHFMDSTGSIKDIEESNQSVYSLSVGDTITMIFHAGVDPEDFIFWSDDDGVDQIVLEEVKND